MKTFKLFAFFTLLLSFQVLPFSSLASDASKHDKEQHKSDYKRGGQVVKNERSKNERGMNERSKNERGKNDFTVGKNHRESDKKSPHYSNKHSDKHLNPTVSKQNNHRNSYRPVHPPHNGSKPKIIPNSSHCKYFNSAWKKWYRPVPVAPMRPKVIVTAPRIENILGLAFGSVINQGINYLIGNNYNVVGAVNDAIYLSNVNRFGILWPQVTVFYGNRGMQSARFQHYTGHKDLRYYDSAYAALCREYGAPVEVVNRGNFRSATWWGGGNTGYVTLSYSKEKSSYYTDLVYGM